MPQKLIPNHRTINSKQLLKLNTTKLGYFGNFHKRFVKKFCIFAKEHKT